MPAFTFEKISPPAPRGPASPKTVANTSVANTSVAGTSVVTKQRGVIVQMLDRFVEARVKRSLGTEKV